MWKDKITIMIVPRSQGEMKQFTVPIKLLWSAGIFGACFVLVNLFLLADYFDQRVDGARLAKLTHENQILSDQFLAMGESITNLESDIGLLVDKEKVIRNIFDLPVINPESRMLGIGGPTDVDLDEITPKTAAALEVVDDVDELIRLARFERERYQEVFKLLTDKRDLLDHTPSIMPARGYMSRGYGYKEDPFTGFRQMHSGLDIANKTGVAIVATANGRVSSVRVNGGMGKMIVLTHGYGYKTRYGHLDKYNVKVGQSVKRGEIIGYMGNTGYSTGPHLHYEVLKNGKAANPYKFIMNK